MIAVERLVGVVDEGLLLNVLTFLPVVWSIAPGLPTPWGYFTCIAVQFLKWVAAAAGVELIGSNSDTANMVAKMTRFIGTSSSEIGPRAGLHHPRAGPSARSLDSVCRRRQCQTGTTRSIAEVRRSAVSGSSQGSAHLAAVDEFHPMDRVAIEAACISAQPPAEV